MIVMTAMTMMYDDCDVNDVRDACYIIIAPDDTDIREDH
jgi:hypothetical protein